MSGGTAEQILKHRASELAQAAEREVRQTYPLTLFHRGGMVLGLQVGEVVGAGSLRQLTVIPGAPGWMAGVVFHRGEVLTLIDLPGLWGMELRGVADLPTYVVVADGAAKVGILVEDLRGVHELDVPPSPWKGAVRAGVTQVTQQKDQPVIVLSARALLADPRIRG